MKKTATEMTTKELIDYCGIFQVQEKDPTEDKYVYVNKLGARHVPDEETKQVLFARKQECLDYFAEERRKEKEAFEERQRKINSIPGLNEIKSARADLEKWHYEFNKSFEGEGAVGGMGVRKYPEYDLDAMADKYPAAMAYLKAEDEAYKENDELSKIGFKALNAIIENPDNYKAIMDQMDAELKEFSNKHLWD
ncbi:MAG: hypothetical protein LUG61_04890 [Lachnospiraceae bacterium]|nr:hypothetical protein [Lachnospiraceae bacterium]